MWAGRMTVPATGGQDKPAEWPGCALGRGAGAQPWGGTAWEPARMRPQPSRLLECQVLNGHYQSAVGFVQMTKSDNKRSVALLKILCNRKRFICFHKES